jgi:hypothetical protein
MTPPPPKSLVDRTGLISIVHTNGGAIREIYVENEPAPVSPE